MKESFKNTILVMVSGGAFFYLAYLVTLYIYAVSIPVLAIGNPAEKINVNESTCVLAEKLLTESDNKSLVFVGDIMLARHVEYLMDQNSPEYPFEQANFINNKPAFVFGNFEASIPTQHKKTPNFNFQFSVSQNNLSGLKKTGFTHLSLANNHTFDYGETGYQNTKEILNKNGITVFGHPKLFGADSISYFSASNTKYAVIALNETQMKLSNEIIEPLLLEAKANSDIQIVYIHWGEEYQHESSVKQRKLAKLLADQGVDIIIGHHPHVIQTIEKIENTIVFYSLGNFIFDQYFSQSVRQGLALRLSYFENQLQIELLPHSSEENLAQPKLATGQKKEIILKEIASYSDKNMREMIEKGIISASLPLASSSEMAIMSP